MSLLGLLPLLNRLDTLIKKITELIEALKGVPPGEPIPPTVVITIPRRSNRYHVFDIDTSVARTDAPLGVKELLGGLGVEFAAYMVVLAVGGGFTYKVNSTGEHAFTAILGEEWDEFEVEEVYITNPAVAGTAQIEIHFRVD